MDQRAVVVIFLIGVAVALAGLGMSKIQSSLGPSPTPTPSAAPLSFGNDPKAAQQPPQSQDQIQQSLSKAENGGQQQQPAVQGAQKTMKQYSQAPSPLPAAQLQGKKAVIVTNKGTIEFQIFPDSPLAASNFIFLANDHFYDGLTFHRVVPGFVIQGGDPKGDGTGGPGYQFKDEPVTQKYDKGIVAMANAGPNTNGSQFFIMLDDNPGLPPNYTIFGKVTSGQDVVDKIAVGDVMSSVTIQPLQ